MRKLIAFLILFLTILLYPPQTDAAIKQTTDPSPIYSNASGDFKVILESDENIFIPKETYSFGFKPVGPRSYFTTAGPKNERVLEFRVRGLGNLNAGTLDYDVWLGQGAPAYNDGSKIPGIPGAIQIFPPSAIDPQTGKQVGLPAIRVDTTIWQARKPQNIYIVNAQPNQDYSIWYSNESGLLWTGHFEANQIGGNKYGDENSATVIINDVGAPSASLKTLCMTQTGAKFNSSITLSCDFRITGINVVAVLPKTLPGTAISNQVGVPSASARPFVPGPCQPVAGKEKEGEVCDTALGPIKTNPAQFIQTIFGILLSLAGGIALLLIIISGYRLMASQGNPEKVQEAREQLTSAIVGLLFVIFSIAILTIIGVDILKIPGFER